MNPKVFNAQKIANEWIGRQGIYQGKDAEVMRVSISFRTQKLSKIEISIEGRSRKIWVDPSRVTFS